MQKIIKNFAKSELSSATLTDSEWNEIVVALNTLLHSHRFNKKNEFTNDLDFSIMRDCLYSVSVAAKDRLLNNKFFALLFVHFNEVGAAKFLKERTTANKSIKYSVALKAELNQLVQQAQGTVSGQ